MSTKQNIYLFHGENLYLSQQKLKFWQTEFIKKYGEESLEVITGKKINLADLITNLETLPFFSEKRMVIIKEFLELANQEDQKKLAENLEKVSDTTILIFHENNNCDKRLSLYKKIHKIGTVEEFKPLSEIEITKWITTKAQKDGITIPYFSAQYMAQYCENDLWIISNEFEKLKLFAQGREITKTDIETVCTPSISASIFKLTDEVSQKKVKSSLKIFENLKTSGEDLIKVFFMLVRHFRILIQVKELVSKGEKAPGIIKKLNQHPFVIQKTSGQSNNFTLEKLEKIYEKLLEIDLKTKTGQIKIYSEDNKELSLAIEQLIMDCCV